MIMIKTLCYEVTAMTAAQQQQAAKSFAAYWKDKGYEKGESQPFWLSLLRDVYGVEHPEQFIQFEEQVHLDHTSFIDGTIPATHVLIEQKGLGKDLNKPIKQSDGALLTPFEQAKRYILELPVSQHPRWVVTCNFSTFYVYDMERPRGEPEIIELANLEKEYYRLQFLVDAGNEHLKREMEVSIAAGEIVGLLYDAFYKKYANPEAEHSLKSLNKLCVRLVFCLYAEDAGIFGHHGMFHDYLAAFNTRELRKALIDLFRVLDTKPQDRDPYLKDDNPDLAAFPYVNGGLFSDEDIEIPPFTDEIRDLLLVKASENFNWSEISPTIFGAVFESTLNPETRRSGGMHYTSIENIHKVIDPLFLDELESEWEEIKARPMSRFRPIYIQNFHDKLSSLIPVCCILMDVLVLHEKVTRRQVLCAVGAVGGVALISAGGAVMISALGLLFLLLTMLSDTVYYGISHSAAKVFTPFEMTYVMFLVGMAAFIPAALFQTGGLHSELITVPAQSGQFWLAVVYLGVLSSGVAYGLLNFANSHLTVSESSLFSNVTTVVSVLAGVILLKEPFSLWQILGVAVILVCVFIANVSASSEK